MPLLFLFNVHRVLPQARTVFFEPELFTARFATDRVVVIPGFLTNEKERFEFFLGHRRLTLSF